MKKTLSPKKLKGRATLPPSKSVAHRLLFLAALGERPATFALKDPSEDIAATLRAVEGLGANVEVREETVVVSPGKAPDRAVVDCGESATTLRMAMMILPTRVKNVVFTGKKSLAARPVKDGVSALRAAGVEVEGERLPLETRGTYRVSDIGEAMNGETTSQFVSGALVAAAAGERPATIEIENETSGPYIDMTAELLRRAGVEVAREGDAYTVCPKTPRLSNGVIAIEGDRSHGAFFLAANELGAEIELTNMEGASVQGDGAFSRLVAELKEKKIVDVTATPDLFIPLALVATRCGGRFRGTGRLKYKESDRVAATADLLGRLGVSTRAEGDRFDVFPSLVEGGLVDTFGDHRIAFAAGILSCAARGTIEVSGAEAVNKSWPDFWRVLESLRA